MENNKHQKDHLAPTELKLENNKQKANLSHEELQERLDAYSRVGGEKDSYFKIQGIKADYLKEINAKEANRTKAHIHYAQGQRAGLPQSHIRDINEAYASQDQKLRDNIAEEAKAMYQDTNSLSRSFKEGKSYTEKLSEKFHKSKNRNMDMER